MPQPDSDICHICQTSRGCGIGFAGRTPADNRWLCVDCSLLIEDIKRVKRLDAHEQAALTAVDDIAGEYAAEHGTDMAAMDDLTRRMLWKTVVQGYGRELRRGIRDNAPF